jgi:hypothetical protein
LAVLSWAKILTLSLSTIAISRASNAARFGRSSLPGNAASPCRPHQATAALARSRQSRSLSMKA